MTNKGFTLVELLVVVLIIGILSSVALPQYTKAVEKARATEAIALLGSLTRAERSYLSLRNTYTFDIAMLDFSVPPGASGDDVDSFTTKNFTFRVSRATGYDFMAYAERRSPNDDGIYTIIMATRRDGQIVSWCFPRKANELETESEDIHGFSNLTKIPAQDEDIDNLSSFNLTDSVKMCKAISDGDPRGIIR